jgi:hypothetical protein
MATTPGRAPGAVSRRRVSLRGLRWSRSYNAMLLAAVLVVLGAFGVWRQIDPPRALVVDVPTLTPVDLPGEAYAQQFAAAYLAWSSSAPQVRTQALAEFVGGGQIDSGFGFQPPTSGSRTVSSTQVVQSFELPDNESEYVVGAVTQPDGLLYLAVVVGRHADGSLGVVGYPALVGAPLTGDPISPPPGTTVEDAALQGVVQRALGNFLAGSSSDLAADLDPSAVVSLPGQTLHLQQLQSLVWAQPGRSVLATVLVRDPHGAQLTLTYQLGVELENRWFVTGIQTSPTAF